MRVHTSRTSLKVRVTQGGNFPLQKNVTVNTNLITIIITSIFYRKVSKVLDTELCWTLLATFINEMMCLVCFLQYESEKNAMASTRASLPILLASASLSVKKTCKNKLLPFIQWGNHKWRTALSVAVLMPLSDPWYLRSPLTDPYPSSLLGWENTETFHSRWLHLCSQVSHVYNCQ